MGAVCDSWGLANSLTAVAGDRRDRCSELFTEVLWSESELTKKKKKSGLPHGQPVTATRDTEEAEVRGVI